MSQAIALAFPTDVSMAFLEQLLRGISNEPPGKVLALAGEVCLMGQEDDWYMVFGEMKHGKEMIEAYVANEELPPEFVATMHEKRFYMVSFNQFEKMRDVLQRMLEQLGAQARETWLDTDYGWVVNGMEVQQRLAQDPTWDWRTPQP